MKINVEVNGLDDLKDSINDLTTNLPQSLAKETTEDFYDTAHNKIFDSFYAGYKPRRYHRTGNLRTIVRRVNHNQSGVSSGGIQVSPRNGREYDNVGKPNGHYWHNSIETVGTNNWFKGIRYIGSEFVHTFNVEITTTLGGFSGKTPDDVMELYADEYMETHIPQKVDEYVKDKLPLD